MRFGGKFNARVAVFIERDGEMYAYMSHTDFVTPPGEVAPDNLCTPEPFMTVAPMRGDEGTPVPPAQGSPGPGTPGPRTPHPAPRQENPTGSARSTSTGLRDYFTFDVEDILGWTA